jgi:hypothetical protein
VTLAPDTTRQDQNDQENALTPAPVEKSGSELIRVLERAAGDDGRLFLHDRTGPRRARALTHVTSA